jgi:hypothetical protein
MYSKLLVVIVAVMVENSARELFLSGETEVLLARTRWKELARAASTSIPTFRHRGSTVAIYEPALHIVHPCCASLRPSYELSKRVRSVPLGPSAVHSHCHVNLAPDACFEDERRVSFLNSLFNIEQLCVN